MLKKLLVAVLACLTIFLSKRATDARGTEHRPGAERVEQAATAAPSVRTAGLF